MTDPRRLIAAVLALTLTAVAGRAAAQELAPAIVFDMGGKFDKSFNEAAYNGAERFKKETGHRVPRVRGDRGGPARAGAAQHGAARLADRRGHRLLPGQRHGEGRQGVPRRQVRHRRRGRGPAQRPVDRVQGARGLVPGRDGRGHGLEDGQGRLRRRHGHPADPQVRPRLRGGRQVRQSEDRGLPEHDRHDAGRVERPDPGRRAGAEPVRPRRRRRLRRRRGHRARRAPGRQGQGAARHRRRLQPEPHPARLGPDLDGQARRPRRLRELQDARRTGRGSPACAISASPRAASATRSTSTTAA